MKMESLKSTQAILCANWVVVPILFIWIAIKTSFINSIIFIVLWLVIDRVWDWISGLLIAAAGRVGASEEEAFDMELSGNVPIRMAVMMIVDLIGTLLIPWIIAGLCLGWF